MQRGPDPLKTMIQALPAEPPQDHPTAAAAGRFFEVKLAGGSRVAVRHLARRVQFPTPGDLAMGPACGIIRSGQPFVGGLIGLSP